MPAVLIPLLVVLGDPIPQDEDVKAGWIGFGLFLGLLVVVGLLGWSLTRHLRNVEANRRSGVYGEEPAAGTVDETADGDIPRNPT